MQINIHWGELVGPANRTELAFILAGYSNIPYDKVLTVSDTQHHSAYERAYNAGIEAQIIFTERT